MGKPYHVVSVAPMHDGDPQETEATDALYGWLAKVASAPNATGPTRKRIKINGLRKTIVILTIPM
jgi:hypothetical protein